LPVNGLVYVGLRLRAVGWLLLGCDDRALRAFDDLVRRFGGRIYPRASRAHLHAQAGRHLAALEDYEVLLRQHPDDARNWFNKGYVLELLGRWSEALAAFERATDLRPDLDRAWYGRGLVLIRLQRFDEAIAALRRNTELQPLSPYGWYQLARAHVDIRQIQEALKIIRHLKGFEPKVAAQLERETGLSAEGVAR
jgi:tetratricopeptide (TPR) repeat protein